MKLGFLDNLPSSHIEFELNDKHKTGVFIADYEHNDLSITIDQGNNCITISKDDFIKIASELNKFVSTCRS